MRPTKSSRDLEMSSKAKGGNSAAKGTTDTPMKGKEQEAALLLNLSKTPPLASQAMIEGKAA